MSGMETGRTGVCWWIWVEGEVTPALHARVVATIRAWAAAPEPSCMLFVARDTNSPSPQQRRELAGALLEARHTSQLRGFALVSASPIVRGTLTAVSWLLRSPVPYASFTTPHEALTWLRGQQREVEPATVEAALAKAVPHATTARW
jgi:hypothetical protein